MRCVRCARHRPPPKATPSLTTPDYGPGETAESDQSQYEVRFSTCKSPIIQALSHMLVSGKRKYFGLYESNDLHPLTDRHGLAFALFGGCARQCKYDSPKPVVLRR